MARKSCTQEGFIRCLCFASRRSALAECSAPSLSHLSPAVYPHSSLVIAVQVGGEGGLGRWLFSVFFGGEMRGYLARFACGTVRNVRNDMQDSGATVFPLAEWIVMLEGGLRSARITADVYESRGSFKLLPIPPARYTSSALT